MLALITAAWLMLISPALPAQQEQNFTPVQGATLQAKQEAAIAQAAGAHAQRFWTAYTFDVRPGVVVDVDYVSDDGHVQIQGTWDTNDSGFLVNARTECPRASSLCTRWPPCFPVAPVTRTFNLPLTDGPTTRSPGRGEATP